MVLEIGLAVLFTFCGGTLMKIVARLLLIAIILSTCFTLASCSVDFNINRLSFNTKFRVSISDMDDFSDLNFEIGVQSFMYVKPFATKVNDDTYKDIEITYNSENLVCEYAYNTRKEVVFKIYCHELTEGDTLSITYKGKTVNTTYTVSDYDFEAHGYIIPTSVDDLAIYPEFMDMLLSLKYYEYTDPYVGLWDKEGVNPPTTPEEYEKSVKYNDSYNYKYYLYPYQRSDSGYIDTGYTAYLKDSMYYPEKFDAVLEDPRPTLDVYLKFLKETDLSVGSGKEEMYFFSINYLVLDPEGTDPEYSLYDLRFSAKNKRYHNGFTVEYGGKTYPSLIGIMFEKHPEIFFEYQLGDTTVYVLCHSSNGARAYFEDDTYFYWLSAAYAND